MSEWVSIAEATRQLSACLRPDSNVLAYLEWCVEKRLIEYSFNAYQEIMFKLNNGVLIHATTPQRKVEYAVSRV